jgi:hypothetical protein
MTENYSTGPAVEPSDVRELIATLSAIPEAIQRSHALAERLRALDDDAILEAIRIIYEKTLTGDQDFLRLYNGLIVSGTLLKSSVPRGCRDSFILCRRHVTSRSCPYSWTFLRNSRVAVGFGLL